MMKIETMRDFFMEELRDLYNAENQLLKALPKLAGKATSPELKAALEAHLDETEVHLERLTTIFKELDASPKGKVCKAMEGIIAEAEEMLKSKMPESIMDAAIIAGAQRAEHYEMAGYGCVRTYARILGEDSAAELLDKTLQEEGAADQGLTKIAEKSVNGLALAEAV